MTQIQTNTSYYQTSKIICEGFQLTAGALRVNTTFFHSIQAFNSINCSPYQSYIDPYTGVQVFVQQSNAEYEAEYSCCQHANAANFRPVSPSSDHHSSDSGSLSTLTSGSKNETTINNSCNYSELMYKKPRKNFNSKKERKAFVEEYKSKEKTEVN